MLRGCNSPYPTGNFMFLSNMKFPACLVLFTTLQQIPYSAAFSHHLNNVPDTAHTTKMDKVAQLNAEPSAAQLGIRYSLVCVAPDRLVQGLGLILTCPYPFSCRHNRFGAYHNLPMLVHL